MIRTKQQWQKERDAAGGKGSLVKGVSLSDLLDAYHKSAVGAPNGIPKMLAQVRTVTPLAAGLKKYKAAIPKDKTKLMAIVDEMIKDVDSQIKLGASLANPVVNLRQYLDKTIAHSKVVMASGDEKAYSKLWNEDVRGMGTGLGKLAKLDPGLKHIHAVWLPYTAGDWDAAGKNVTGKIADPAQKTNRIKAAAKEINGLAIKIQSELKQMKVIA